jgi:hypothetical protein
VSETIHVDTSKPIDEQLEEQRDKVERVVENVFDGQTHMDPQTGEVLEPKRTNPQLRLIGGHEPNVGVIKVKAGRLDMPGPEGLADVPKKGTKVTLEIEGVVVARGEEDIFDKDGFWDRTEMIATVKPTNIDLR